LPFQDAQLAEKENEMPPKRKPKKSVYQALLQKQQAQINELKALLLKKTVENDPHRGASPTEQAKLSASAKRARTKKGRKSNSGSPVADPLQGTKDMIIIKTVGEIVLAEQKFAKGPGTQEELASLVLFFGQPGHGMDSNARQVWYKEFGPVCTSELNKLRSTVQSAIKKEIKILRNNSNTKTMVPVHRWEDCLRRNLNMNNVEDVELFTAYHNRILAKAVGTDTRWNKHHRGYFCIYNGKPPGARRPIELYVTPETEAYTVFVIRGNYNRWNAQFEISDKFPRYSQKAIFKEPTVDAIAASDVIKERLYREKHALKDDAALPAEWENTMKCSFELAEDSADTVRLFVVVAVLFVKFSHSLTLFWP
jgi:hypothetical protein